MCAWKINLEVNTVVLVTNEDLNQGGTGEKDKKEVDFRGGHPDKVTTLGQACSE